MSTACISRSKLLVVSGQRLHLNQNPGDQMGQPLHHGRFAVMIFRRRHDDVEGEARFQECRDASRPAAHGAKGDFQTGNAVARALRAEKRVGGDDIDMRAGAAA